MTEISRNDYINQPSPIEDELSILLDKKSSLIILDIGSCEGEDAIRYSRLFPKSRIFAFEALPDNCNLIQENLKKYFVDNVEMIPFALSDEDNRKIPFYVSSGHPEGVQNSKDWNFGNKSSSLLPPSDGISSLIPWLQFSDVIEVETRTLWSFCQEKSIDCIDFIHLDVQGAELKVLRGAKNFISKIKVIWLEVEQEELYDEQPLREEVESFMIRNKFVKMKDTVQGISGDQLYINSSYFKVPLVLFKIASLPISYWFQKRIGGLLSLLNSQQENNRKISYSQSGEDIIIDYIFNGIGIDKPSYIDVGAHDPKHFNNTYLFYQTGAKGVNIEPDPTSLKRLQKSRKRDVNLNAAVADYVGETDLFIFSVPTLNTCSRIEAEKYAREGYKIKSILKVKVETIHNIVDKYFNGNFPDLLTIDVEGWEERILSSINFDLSSPSVICVETISYSNTGNGVKNRNIIKLLENKGYLLYADTYINSIFVKRDKWVDR